MGEPSMWVETGKYKSEAVIEFRDPDGFWSAFVKWDGCIHLHHRSMFPAGEEASEFTEDQDIDHIHLCGGLDEMIERLQQLKAAAEKHFGSDWPQ